MTHRPLHALCTLLLLVCAGCGAPRAGSAHTPPADALRVMTYNTHHGEGTDGVLDLERIARVIRDADPDLVALQEIDVGAERTGGVDQAAELARLTGMHHAFGAFMDFQGGEYGLAVLSRHPIWESRRIVIPAGEREPRVVLAADVAIPGRGSVTLVSLHLDWLENDDDRYAQAVAIVEHLADERAVVLAGDFNDVPGSRTMAHFAEHGYVDASKPGDARGTFPSHAPSREIDFVMHRPAGAFTSTARVLDERVASDHRPVLATLEWADAQAGGGGRP